VSAPVAAVSRADTPQNDATTEERLEYLMRRDHAVRDSLERLDRSVEAMPSRWSADIRDASASLRGEFIGELKREREAHLNERILGVGLLAVGIILATVGNLA
jgi:hypothetical protein